MSGVAFPEQDGFEDLPNLSVTPMLAKYISRVGCSCDMNKVNNLRRNGFSKAMEGQCIVLFGKFSMWHIR